jgi:Bacterial Ig domain
LPGPSGLTSNSLNQQLFTAAGVTFWVQADTGVTPASNTLVTLNDTKPTADQWNFSSVEVLATGATPPPPDITSPLVNIVTPTTGQTMSGTVTVTANATDNVALGTANPVLFFLDGTTNQLPGSVTVNGSLFSTSWDTTRSANGTHSLSAVATDSSNNKTTATTSGLILSNPPPISTCFIVDRTVAAHGRGPVTTASTGFNTALPGELLVAFAGSDGPNSGGSQTLTVSGAGLSWKLVKRANAQAGTSEVWTATAPSNAALTNATFTATQARSGYDVSLYVIAVQGTGGIGASVAASASSGAPTLSIKTTAAGSLLYGVGEDWDRSAARTVGTNQLLDNQFLDTSTGDTYWTQNQTFPPLIPAGASVILNDTAPAGDRWNFVGVEILAEDN